MNTKKMLAVIAVLAMACAAFAVAVPSEDVAADDEVITVQGDVTSAISGTATQTIKIIADTTIKGGSITSEGTLIVDEGVTVTIEDGLLEIKGDATIDGTIISECGSYDASDNTPNTASKGLIITPAEYKEAIVNGTIEAIGNNTSQGIKSLKIIGNRSDVAKGDVIVNGTVKVGTGSIAFLDGIEFSKGSSLTVRGGLYTSAASTDGFKGIKTAGYTCLDLGITGGTRTFNIIITDPAAVIDVKNIGYMNNASEIVITDAGMFAYDFGNNQYYVEVTESGTKKYALAYDEESESFSPITANSITLTKVSNVRITETVVTGTAYDKTTSQNQMYADIQMVISALDAEASVEPSTGTSTQTPAISVTKGEGVCFGTMDIDGVAVTVNGASADYKVTVTVTGIVKYSGDAAFTVGQYGTLDVDGSIVKKASEITNNGTINAATFNVTVDNIVYYNYTTLKNAIELGATDIKAMGTLEIKENTTLPAATKLTLDKTADNSLLVKKDATLTIADGAIFMVPSGSGSMYINGTLVFENITESITLEDVTIYADVKLEDGRKVTYTNVYVAFAAAKSGDKIQAYNPLNYEITLDADLILPAGVEFDNNLSTDSTKYATIYVKNGVQFTVAGKLVIKGENTTARVLAEEGNGWNDKTPKADGGVMKEYSVLAIGPQGVIEFKITEAGRDIVDDSLYKTHLINGAYFAMKDDAITNYYITNIEYAFGVVLDTEQQAYDTDKYANIIVAGDANIDNLKLSGTADERVTVFFEFNDDDASPNTVTMKNFIFAYGKVIFEDGVIVTGDIGTSTGKIVFDGAEVMDESTFNEEWIDDAMNLKVIGSFESKKVTSVSGTVYLGYFDYDAISTDNDDNKFIVAAGSKLVIVGTVDFSANSSDYTPELLAEGTVIVSYLGSLKAYLVSVLGTLDVQKVDGKAGSADILNLYVGGSLDSFKTPYLSHASSGAASVIGSGDFTLNGYSLLVVFKGASVTADVLADWMAKDTTKSTEFYVDGALWITAYGSGVVFMNYSIVDDVSYFTPVLTDKKFDSWQTYDEEKKDYVSLTDTTLIGAVDKVYAKIETSIYLVEINTEVGIDNVYIDGKILEKDGLEFSGYVAAGTHTITIAASNGYSAENAYIAEIDGKALVGSGLTFTVNDESYIVQDTYYHKDIVLQGVQKSGYDVDPETHPETVAGLSVTEILLIVVVIIMAIMAVVLILRLNRS